MCGRYVSPEDAAIEREFNLLHTEWRFPPCFNVAPTQEVPIVRMRDGRRQGVRLRWGLIPYFAKGVPPKYSTINARIETVQTAASHRGPWSRGQRCLVAARGFYAGANKRSLRVNQQKRCSCFAEKVGLLGICRSNARITRPELPAALSHLALENIDELRTGVSMPWKVNAWFESHQLHRLTVRGAEIL
ncbi:MAG TPA: SOS response-associated peptidase family protein, partial [Steroidobacteraceae bacterium]